MPILHSFITIVFSMSFIPPFDHYCPHAYDIAKYLERYNEYPYCLHSPYCDYYLNDCHVSKNDDVARKSVHAKESFKNGALLSKNVRTRCVSKHVKPGGVLYNTKKLLKNEVPDSKTVHSMTFLTNGSQMGENCSSSQSSRNKSQDLESDSDEARKFSTNGTISETNPSTDNETNLLSVPNKVKRNKKSFMRCCLPKV